MKNDSENWNLINWIFFTLFVSIGVLNIIFVHFVPGIIYILISFIYLSFTNTFIKKIFGFSIPIAMKIIIALIVLWFTLGVSDLMEMFESWMNR